MRTALLCMSVEPGRDGVGDYVRQLAAGLSSRGHACQVVALADGFVDQASVTVDADHDFEIVRIPRANWRRADIGFAVKRLTQFRPDWVSLQMVSYGFEERGLLWRSAGRFARLRAAPRRHLMFHELWIGANQHSSRKDRVVGCLQRRLLQRATRVWSPRVVHTSNAVYREMLRGADIDAAELPLPGNIPVREVSAATARAHLLALLPERLPAGEPLLAGVFGSIHPQWATSAWVDELSALCKRQGRRLVIVQIGRAGAIGKDVLAQLRRQADDRVVFLELGERSAEEVSLLLQGLDVGLATTPWPLIGKSGAAAAMLEHGLPVLVTREDHALRTGVVTPNSPHPRLYRLREFCAALEKGTLTRGKPQPRSDIYDAFIGALECAS